MPYTILQKTEPPATRDNFGNRRRDLGIDKKYIEERFRELMKFQGVKIQQKQSRLYVITNYVHMA